jgi:hypothetical protein
MAAARAFGAHRQSPARGGQGNAASFHIDLLAGYRCAHLGASGGSAA